jgi:hypothetical protein
MHRTDGSTKKYNNHISHHNNSQQSKNKNEEMRMKWCLLMWVELELWGAKAAIEWSSTKRLHRSLSMPFPSLLCIAVTMRTTAMPSIEVMVHR